MNRLIPCWYSDITSGRSGSHSPATPDDPAEGAIGGITMDLPPIDTHLQIDRIHAADCWCNPLGPNGRPEVQLDGIDDRPKVILEPFGADR